MNVPRNSRVCSHPIRKWSLTGCDFERLNSHVFPLSHLASGQASPPDLGSSADAPIPVRVPRGYFCDMGQPSRLMKNQVTEVATLAVPSLGLVSHPGRVPLGWCEHQRGRSPGGGTRQDTGALSALDRRPLCGNQEVGWAETD